MDMSPASPCSSHWDTFSIQPNAIPHLQTPSGRLASVVARMVWASEAQAGLLVGEGLRSESALPGGGAPKWGQSLGAGQKPSLGAEESASAILITGLGQHPLGLYEPGATAACSHTVASWALPLPGGPAHQTASCLCAGSRVGSWYMPVRLLMLEVLSVVLVGPSSGVCKSHRTAT